MERGRFGHFIDEEVEALAQLEAFLSAHPRPRPSTLAFLVAKCNRYRLRTITHLEALLGSSLEHVTPPVLRNPCSQSTSQSHDAHPE